MELVELWRVVRKRLWMILLITIVAGLTSAILSKYVLTKEYASTATLIVIPHETAQDLLTSMVTGQQLVDTYAQVVTTRTVLGHVDQALNLGLSLQTLTNRVVATPDTNTNLLTITVTSPSPTWSARVTNAVANRTVAEVTKLTQQRNLVVADPAVPIPIPVAPKTATNTAIAVVLGLLVGGGLAFLLEYLDDSLRSEEDVRRVLDLPVLGVIPLIEEDVVREVPAKKDARARRGPPPSARPPAKGREA
jgi:capsular polysaccharide biosynthesis protein